MHEAEVRMWLATPLPRDAKMSIDRLARAPDVRFIRIMPDVHLAHDVCVGTVLATRQLVYPAAIGADPGCGMAAVALDCGADVLGNQKTAGKLLAALYRLAPSNRQPAPLELPPELSGRMLSAPQLEKLKPREGRAQFRTLGRGNHFIEFQADDEGRMWLMIHCGSRAIGQAIHDLHVTRAQQADGGFCCIDGPSAAGQAFLSDLDWAISYAAANRRAMALAIGEIAESILGGTMLFETFFDCCHNHVRREAHAGEALWVHRKGVNSARLGEAGIIPGSMGTASFHVEGRGNAESLCSSSHGAGRAMSRTEARKRISMKAFQREMGGVWYDHRLAGSLRDEAPSAYRDSESVLRAQRELVKITRRLKPLLSYKGV